MRPARARPRGIALTKDRIAAGLVKRAGLVDAEAVWLLEEVLELMASALEAGDPIKIVNFGQLRIAHRASQRGRHPRTGEPIQIQARRIVRFVAAPALKDALNPGDAKNAVASRRATPRSAEPSGSLHGYHSARTQRLLGPGWAVGRPRPHSPPLVTPSSLKPAARKLTPLSHARV